MTLPIKKTILASLAFIVVNWRKIIDISIIPLAFSLPLVFIIPELLIWYKQVIPQLIAGQVVDGIAPPENALLYMALFIYGYAMLSINLSRLVVLGSSAVSVLGGVLEVGKNFKYIGLVMMVGFTVIFPAFVTGLFFVQLAVYFLIVPVTLNFINIAIGKELSFRWNLPFVAHMNLFFVQVLLPTTFAFLFGLLADALGFNDYVSMFAQVIIFYWSAINLAFCYRIITTDNSAQSL